MSGYPTDNSGLCKYDGVVQWWSTGTLLCRLDGSGPQAGLYRTDIDSCGGGTGSVVYDKKTKRAWGIFEAEYITTIPGLCFFNLVTRILDNAGGGVNSGLGVSIRSLMAAVPV